MNTSLKSALKNISRVILLSSIAVSTCAQTQEQPWETQEWASCKEDYFDMRRTVLNAFDLPVRLTSLGCSSKLPPNSQQIPDSGCYMRLKSLPGALSSLEEAYVCSINGIEETVCTNISDSPQSNIMTMLNDHRCFGFPNLLAHSLKEENLRTMKIPDMTDLFQKIIAAGSLKEPRKLYLSLEDYNRLSKQERIQLLDALAGSPSVYVRDKNGEARLIDNKLFLDVFDASFSRVNKDNLGAKANLGTVYDALMPILRKQVSEMDFSEMRDSKPPHTAEQAKKPGASSSNSNAKRPTDRAPQKESDIWFRESTSTKYAAVESGIARLRSEGHTVNCTAGYYVRMIDQAYRSAESTNPIHSVSPGEVFGGCPVRCAGVLYTMATRSI